VTRIGEREGRETRRVCRAKPSTEPPVTDEQRRMARELGRLPADRGHEVVCGGLGGAMAAVCRGARENGGHTIGILPGEDRAAANSYVETPAGAVEHVEATVGET
jgi:uncharacterized protein (TIGR00725 family)